MPSVPRKPRHAPPSAGAFTLIEMMVVLVLIGIMTAMIIPEMKGTYEDALLRSTSRELIDAFDLCGSRSVNLNQIYRFRLDVASGRYIVEKRATEDTDEFVPLEDVPGCKGKLDTRISIEMSSLESGASEPSAPGASAPPGAVSGSQSQQDGILFYPDGTADATELLLRDRDGFRLALRLNPVTARVRVIQLDRAAPGSL